MKKWLVITAAVFAALLFLGACTLQTGSTGEASFPALNIRNIPSGLTSFSLTVTGEGMDPIEVNSLPDGGSVILEVPSGTERMFSIEIGTPSVTLSGEQTADLEAGRAEEIIIDLTLSDMKLVIPDMLNHRIVQIDDMNGNGWTERAFPFDGIQEFLPSDVDFDNKGRIYVSNYGWSESILEGIVRLDHIGDTNAVPIVTGTSINTISIDRENNYIYYSDGYSLARKELTDPAGPEQLFNLQAEAELVEFMTTGIDAAGNGVVYLANQGVEQVVAYDTTKAEGSRVTAVYLPLQAGISDVLVRNGELYTTGSYTIEGEVPLERYVAGNTSSSMQYGFFSLSPDTSPGAFYGPQRFVESMDGRFYIIDDDGNNKKLVSLADYTGAAWDTYGTSGTGTGEFLFFMTIPQ